MFITLKPRGQRKATADQVIAGLNQALQPVQGIRLYMQAAQDVNVGARLSKTQYQYTLVDVDSDELNHKPPFCRRSCRNRRSWPMAQVTSRAPARRSTSKLIVMSLRALALIPP
jgi:multidrug efflux pump subunit AcrB